jgi:hypothetical protein
MHLAREEAASAEEPAVSAAVVVLVPMAILG